MASTREELFAEASKQLSGTETLVNMTIDVGKGIGPEVFEELQTTDLKTEPVSDHRDLRELHDGQEITIDTRRNKEYERSIVDMKNRIQIYRVKKEAIEEEIKNVTVTKQLIIKDISNYKKQLIAKLNELEQKSIDVVNERFREVTEKMKRTTREIDEMLKQIDDTLREVWFDRQTQTDRIKETAAVLIGKDLRINTGTDGFEGVSMCLDKNIQTLLEQTTSLVSINRPCQANLARKVDVRFASDRETCGISDICSLPDGSMVITDLSNDCLKMLDDSFNRMSRLQLDGGLLGVCATRYGEIAVTLRENKTVQFIEYTETEMRPTKYFRADSSCNYICCEDDILFVTCEGGDEDNGLGHVRKFDLTGNLLGVIETDILDRRIFTTPLHITRNANQSKLFITDMDGKVIVLDKAGKKLVTYRNHLLESAFGITVLPNDNILVSSLDSHSVQQFDEKGRYVGTILSKVSGLENPVCVKHIASSRQIIVGLDDSNTLLVFNATVPSA